LSAYNYEVSCGIYVGAYHAGLYKRVLKWLRENTQKSEHILIIRRNTQVVEGFEEQYINWESDAVDFDGIKLFKTQRALVNP
jgi:hypothetical protein